MGKRLAPISAIELLLGDRVPPLVDELCRLSSTHLFDRELEVLGPQPLPCRAGELRLATDEIDLGVVEERVLVQIRRADRQPAVVDDPDLRVDVDRLPVSTVARVERAGQEPPGAGVRIGEHADLAAAVVVAVVGTRRQDGDDAKIVPGRVSQLLGEDLDQLRRPEELALEVDEALG